MHCRISELRDKQVVCIGSGIALGPVCDVQIDTCTGQLEAIVVFSPGRFLGLLGSGEDIIIPWCEIKVIGPDTVLVGVKPPEFNRRGGFFKRFQKR